MVSTVGQTPRIGRILAAAHTLGVNGGTRSITISEIARLAGVGRGTLYLYWSNKEDLLADLFAHDMFEMLSEIEQRVRIDPALIAPHRLLPLVVGALDQHPFAAEVHSSDSGPLRSTATHPGIIDIKKYVGPVAIISRIFPVLRRHLVIRSDLDVEAQVYAAVSLIYGLENRELVALKSDHVPTSNPQSILGRTCAVLLEPLEPLEPDDYESAAIDALADLSNAKDVALRQLHSHGLGRTKALR